MAEKLYADNDIDYRVYLEDINPATGVKEPVTSGSVAAWFVPADSPEEAEAMDSGDAFATADLSHIGTVAAEDEDLANEIFRNGTWLIHVDRDDVDRATLDDLFLDDDGRVLRTPKPFLVLNDPAGVRVVREFAYKPYRKAAVA